MKSKSIKILGIFFYLGIILIILCTPSCSRKLTLDEYVSKELEKDIRKDSLVYGVHFGMTFKEFDTYCFQMNKNGIFKQNPNGSAVRLELHEGFGDIVYFDFFPEASASSRITKLNGTLSYKNFSYFNKNLDMKYLLNETKTFFEKGYKGNKFFEIPNEKQLLKYKYVKIDGNRKIVLTPMFDGQKIVVDFEDTTAK